MLTMLTMRDDEGLALLGDLRRRGFTATVSPDDPTRLRVTPLPEEADVRAIVAYKPALLDRLRREVQLLEAGARLGYPALAWTAPGEAAWWAAVPGLHPLLLGGFSGICARREASLRQRDFTSVDVNGSGAPRTGALWAQIDPAGARPAPYWPALPDPGPVPEYAARLDHQRETGRIWPDVHAAWAYRREQKRSWDARMHLVERAAAQDPVESGAVAHETRKRSSR